MWHRVAPPEPIEQFRDTTRKATSKKRHGGCLNQVTPLTSRYPVSLVDNPPSGYDYNTDFILPTQPRLTSLQLLPNPYSSGMEVGSPVRQQNPCISGRTGEYEPSSITCRALLQVTHGTDRSPMVRASSPPTSLASHHPSLNPTLMQLGYSMEAKPHPFVAELRRRTPCVLWAWLPHGSHVIPTCFFTPG